MQLNLPEHWVPHNRRVRLVEKMANLTSPDGLLASLLVVSRQSDLPMLVENKD